MTKPSSATRSEVWRFATDSSQLSLAPISGEVTIANPGQGIGRLTWNGAQTAGHVLGVSAGTSTTREDAFTRENDLVAVYAETEPQTFSWQVYWRASSAEHGVVLIDVILSLQTPLLESFPQVTTSTWLPAGEVVTIGGEGDCVLLRPAECDWSYAEMTHPKDRGTYQLISATENQLQRELGGQFMEKGVIRRLRVRGAFLPRENDSELATRYFGNLASETPPLTA